MARYIRSVATVKFGTPTGSNTMPGTLTSLPDTVKGSVTLDESEASYTEFYVDQKPDPVEVVPTEKGKLTADMQFYDYDFVNMAALTGGTAPTGGGSSKYVPGTTYPDVKKALEITLDTGQKVNLFNARISIRPITGGGGRDRMLAWALKAYPLMTTDLAGSWEIDESD